MKIAPAVTETRMHVVAIFRVVRFFPEKAAWHRFFLDQAACDGSDGLGRVAPGDCSPKAATDPDLRIITPPCHNPLGWLKGVRNHNCAAELVW